MNNLLKYLMCALVASGSIAYATDTTADGGDIGKDWQEVFQAKLDPANNINTFTLALHDLNNNVYYLDNMRRQDQQTYQAKIDSLSETIGSARDNAASNASAINSIKNDIENVNFDTKALKSIVPVNHVAVSLVGKYGANNVNTHTIAGNQVLRLIDNKDNLSTDSIGFKEGEFWNSDWGSLVIKGTENTTGIYKCTLFLSAFEQHDILKELGSLDYYALVFEDGTNRLVKKGAAGMYSMMNENSSYNGGGLPSIVYFNVEKDKTYVVAASSNHFGKWWVTSTYSLSCDQM